MESRSESGDFACNGHIKVTSRVSVSLTRCDVLSARASARHYSTLPLSRDISRTHPPAAREIVFCVCWFRFRSVLRSERELLGSQCRVVCLTTSAQDYVT